MCYKYGWVIKGGQKHITSNHEKGSRDQNLKAEKRETFSKVGEFQRSEIGNQARRASSASALGEPTHLPENLASWLGQTSVEVGLSGPTAPGEVSDRIP